MIPSVSIADVGLEVLDNQKGSAFAESTVNERDIALQTEGLRRIARAFVDKPATILQELVNAAIDLCGADSAGISIEKDDRTDTDYYHWVATAGQYSQFLNAILPRHPSACGICLERGGPQRFRVGQAFFDLMGIEAPLVTDGILLPWRTEQTRGTIFVMAHGRQDAFGQNDCLTMEILADFAAMGVRQQRQQRALVEQAGATAAAGMANELAHKINNPLQGLTNLLFLAAEGPGGKDARELARQAFDDLERLSALVKTLLEVPFQKLT